jgi:hypothetical protein
MSDTSANAVVEDIGALRTVLEKVGTGAAAVSVAQA